MLLRSMGTPGKVCSVRASEFKNGLECLLKGQNKVNYKHTFRLYTIIFAAFIEERFLSVSSKCCVEGLFKMCEMVI